MRACANAVRARARARLLEEELGGEAEGLRRLVARLGAAVLLGLRLLLVELLQLGLNLLAEEHLRHRGGAPSSPPW